ncbi:hypothetical protein AB0C89_12955, partial [Streptomyces sp. NPDC048491]|uniref:hypothetical protein n=1 Tax=Streptomyces sp. NPDC048491 TaxID=3157207 RepID=UPI003437B1BE
MNARLGHARLLNNPHWVTPLVSDGARTHPGPAVQGRSQLVLLGFVIVGLFVVVWAAALAYWRLGKVE